MKSNTAEQLSGDQGMAVGTPRPVKVSPHTDARAMAVAEFRALADRLESGELYGARVEWREGLDHVVAVEAVQDRGDGKWEVNLQTTVVSPTARVVSPDGITWTKSDEPADGSQG